MSLITYDLRKLPVAPGQTDPGYRPVVANSNQLSDEQLYDVIVKRTSLDEGDVKSALSTLADVIANQLSQGNTVNIPELGTFSLSLTSDQKISSADDKQAADHIHVAGINFRAKKAFQRRVGAVTFHRTRYPNAGEECADVSEAKSIITSYFSENPNALLTSTNVQRLLHCSRTVANLRLSALVADGTLLRIGRRNAPYYRLVEGE